MNKLEQYIYDYGTDGLEAFVQLLLAKNNIQDDLSRTLAKMVSELTEGLREYGMTHDLKNKVADYR